MMTGFEKRLARFDGFFEEGDDNRVIHYFGLSHCFNPENPIGMVPNVPGAHTQAETLDELQRNLQEVLELCLEENPELANETLHFVGT